jgi:uncharacterized membrane protein YccC
MPGESTATSDVHEFYPAHLTSETFEPIYNIVVGLKFPMEVARVLELRYLINHTVDAYVEPVLTPDYREFREALQTLVDGIGIDDKRHCERMLRILSMMRELHYTYSIKTRDAENDLRAEITDNRRRRRHGVRYALGLTLAAILSAILWLGVPELEWPIKVLTTAFAFGAWLYLRTLPALDRALAELEKRMNQLQRHRVRSIHWRLLGQKLSLLLGFKRSSDVEVFIIDTEQHDYSPSHLRH